MSDPSVVRWLDADATARYLSLSKRQFLDCVSRGVLPNAEGGRWSTAAIDAVMTAPKPNKLRNGRPAKLALVDVETILRNAKPISTFSVGIYFLIDQGEIVYVGQTDKGLARVAQHLATKKFDSWHWVPCPLSELNATERAYINALRPRLNGGSRA